MSQSAISESAVSEKTYPSDNFHRDLPLLEPTTWVWRYKPAEASSGYNLVLYNRRLPMLIDMNGNLVHVWPMVRAVGRARLNREGGLLVISRGGLVEEYDWNGDVTWFFQAPKGHLTHHDVIELANGNRLVLAIDDQAVRRTYLAEVNSEQEVVWRWLAEDHLPAFPGWDSKSADPAHINSVNELPPNRWFDAGDTRFRPGNILVSARNLNAIFIIDKSNGEVVWRYSDGLDYQHEAIMVERGLTGAGLITVFNNGFNDLFHYRRSGVQAINPVKKKVKWEYSSKFFFSGTGGTARRLAGGTTLINSTHGGRTFEIDSRGKIVWEMVPPGNLGRTERVPYDHCPQLRSIPRPEEAEVRPKHRGAYVDTDLYNYVPGNVFKRKKVGGEKRKLLPWGDTCRDLLIPPGAKLSVGCGIFSRDSKGESGRARFKLSISGEDGQQETLVDLTIDENSRRKWRWFEFRLQRFAYEAVRLCLTVEADESVERPEEVFAWAYPQIRSKWQTPEEVATSRRVSKQERELQRQQLEALGYVD